MKRSKLIRIKAGFLITVFSLNTIVGFGCSIGFDKIISSILHHKDDKKSGVHIHADGTKHIHEKEETKYVVHVHADGKKHVHKADSNDDIKLDAGGYINIIQNATGNFSNTNLKDIITEQSRESKENCCSSSIIKFDQAVKAIPPTVKLNLIFFATIVAEFYNINVLYTSYINTSIRYFVRSYHPPISNIRIAIQSFQI